MMSKFNSNRFWSIVSSSTNKSSIENALDKNAGKTQSLLNTIKTQNGKKAAVNAAAK
ncbi:hypothetical protein [Polycladidibacter stylochi]|uniref:hypothetical protein n=1 Tax=Polycladidibacter stylochi TaxID=1807766 RepID=UPI000A53CEDC|nr:hypothetical protein [Pseudovibrio stylochi]